MSDFEKITNKKVREIYLALWENNRFLNGVNIQNTSSGKDAQKVSSYSFSFAGDEKKDDLLINRFKIIKTDLFKRKFEMACGGSGREYRRITTLHSSSLCALLFFYNVTEENPIIIDEVTYTESIFEFKSPVIMGNNPSNMDVVLIGRDSDGNDVVFFLESKFAEYITSASHKFDNLSVKYLKHRYSKMFYEEEHLKKYNAKLEMKDEKYAKIRTKDIMYFEGIKQMISHYIGIRNDINGDFYSSFEFDEHETVKQKIINGAKIILGEILFDHKIGRIEIDKGVEGKSSYAKHYSSLKSKIDDEINKANLGERFVVMNEIGYSLFNRLDQKHEIEEKICEFYFGEEYVRYRK